MNYLKCLFTVGALLTAVAGFAADNFQGKVTLAISGSKGKSQELNYSIKGHKLRMDLQAEKHEVATIMDLDKLEMLILMPEQQMYMVMPVKKPIEKAMEKSTDSNADIDVTGKTETILGYKCEQILVKDKGNVTEMWLAQGLGSFQGLGQQGGGGPFARKSAASAKWEEALKGRNGFPLRVITRDPKSKETFKMEATKIEPGTLADSLFTPPASYQKFQMPSLGGLLKGGE